MAKVRNTYRYIRIEGPKEMPKPSKEKRDKIRKLVESYNLKVKEVGTGHTEELGGFAHGGTFYGVNILSVDPPDVFIEDDDFYQYGIEYTRPDHEWESYVEGKSSNNLKGGIGTWVKNPYHEVSAEGEYIYSTTILEKDSRPDMFETDKDGRFVVDWKIVPIFE
jgi:hypothetical protein